jgi:hypothetical protein
LKPNLKAPGSKLQCDEPLSEFAVKFNLRRYNVVADVRCVPGRLAGTWAAGVGAAVPPRLSAHGRGKLEGGSPSSGARAAAVSAAAAADYGVISPSSADCAAASLGRLGKAVPVDPIKPTLTAPGIERLRLIRDDPFRTLLSNSTCSATSRWRRRRRRVCHRCRRRRRQRGRRRHHFCCFYHRWCCCRRRQRAPHAPPDTGGLPRPKRPHVDPRASCVDGIGHRPGAVALVAGRGSHSSTFQLNLNRF